ncbi:MAG TPA: SDR family oxidoreductase [Thermoplasmata archaeon]|nr:SDR family oxidoreductase [Thermoplasmata archaeon]
MTEERTAIVTGASSGIGRAVALRLGAKGMRIALVARRKERLAEAAKVVEARGGEAMAIPGDVRDAKLAKTVVESVMENWKRLDVLVNNAGIGKYAPVEDLSEASLREQFETNVVAPFLFTKAAVPIMKRQKSGQIVNIGSVVGLVGSARGTAYIGTKWALRGMNECWREELYPHGIKVAYLAPGYVISEFGGRKEDMNLPEAEWALTPDDVARAVEFVVDQGPNSDVKEIVVQVRDRS